MDNCSTLVYIVDNTTDPASKLIDVYQSMDDMDTTLALLFNEAEISVPDSLVKRTLEKVKL